MTATAAVLLALLFLALLRRHAAAPSRFVRALVSGLGSFAVFSAFAVPLGPSDREVRRQPWVTYGIVLACLLVFQLQLLHQPGPGWRHDVRAAWSAAVDYAVKHPRLPLPPALEEFLGAEIRRRTAAAARVEAPSTAGVAAEQQELDRHTAELLRVLDEKPERRWGAVPARASWVTSLSSMFVHGGWMHLLGNMVFLVFAGAFVEDVYGRVLFLALYLGAGLCGDWASFTAHPGSHAASYGASGAIAGVEGAFLVRFATRRLEFLSLPALWLPVWARVSIPAYLYLVPWLIDNAISLARGVPGVGWHAHIGGFLFGLLFAAVMRLALVEERLVHPRIEAKVSLRQHPAVASAFAQRMAGRPAAAQRTVARALAEAPRDLGLLREAYDSAVAAGDPAAAAHHAAQVLDSLRPQTDRDSVREGLRYIRDVEAALDGAAQPRFWQAAAEYLETRGDKTRAMLYYERIAEGPDPALARRAAFRKERLRRQVTMGAVCVGLQR